MPLYVGYVWVTLHYVRCGYLFIKYNYFSQSHQM